MEVLIQFFSSSRKASARHIFLTAESEIRVDNIC